MKWEDVKFTDRLTNLYKDLEGLPHTKEGDLWDDEYIEGYILDKKHEYLMDFQEFMVNRIKVFYPEIYSKANQTSEIKIKNLNVDYISKADSRYTIKVGVAEYNKIWFIGFSVGMMMWVAPIQNIFFNFNDLNMEHIHNNIDINTSIQDSAATKYIKNKIKPRPISDASSKKARDLFGGLMD